MFNANQKTYLFICFIYIYFYKIKIKIRKKFEFYNKIFYFTKHIVKDFLNMFYMRFKLNFPHKTFSEGLKYLFKLQFVNIFFVYYDFTTKILILERFIFKLY